MTDDTYDIRPDAKRFENWETNVAAKLGLGAAVDYALDLGIEKIWSRIQVVADRLRSELASAGGVAVHDKGAVRGGIVTFTVDGRSAEEVNRGLSDAGINTSVSRPEYARYDLPHRQLPALVRASVHYYNTDTEIDRLLEVLAN